MIVVLCGGFGAARFVGGLAPCLSAEALVCVVNTADDFEHLGMYVCPDLDSVTYALAGRFAEERGFGLQDDTFSCNSALGRYGRSWFLMGDQDIAHSLARTALLDKGMPLSAATAEITRGWDLPARVLPMSDQQVRTRIGTGDGELAFQDYIVAHRGEPRVEHVRYDGIEQAASAPGVLDLLSSASTVLLAPSNPVSSLGPILALPDVRERLRLRGGPTVAVTPVVVGRAPKREAERHRATVRAALLAAQGALHTPRAVAGLYADFLDGFVLDVADRGDATAIEELGLAIHLSDTLAAPQDRGRFAAEVLAFAGSLGA